MNELYVPVLREVALLGRAFAEAGYELYLVGGIVRDIHLGAPLGELDVDLTTDAHPRDIKALIAPLSTAVWTQGERFGTIGCQINGRPIEITTHRAESYSDSSRKPEVAFGDDINVDLSRRDFTLNSMAIRITTGELIDPFDGLSALEERVLVTPIEPEVSFSDDPLRVLRASRFIARYGLSVDPALMTAAQELSDRMSIVSIERVRDELDKLLSAPEPSAGLSFLAEVGAWPFVASPIASSQLATIGEQLDATPVDLTLRRAVVFSHSPATDRDAMLSALRYSNDDVRQQRVLLAGLDLVRSGDQRFDAPAIRRLVAQVGFQNMSVLMALIESLGLDDRGLGELFDDLNAGEDLSNLVPVMTGVEVMALLELGPGPEVGAALGVLQERRFDDGPLDAGGEAEFLRGRYRS